MARQEDESTGFVLPRSTLARVAAALPATAAALREVVGGGSKLVLQRAAEVLAVVAAAQQAGPSLQTSIVTTTVDCKNVKPMRDAAGDRGLQGLLRWAAEGAIRYLLVAQPSITKPHIN